MKLHICALVDDSVHWIERVFIFKNHKNYTIDQLFCNSDYLAILHLPIVYGWLFPRQDSLSSVTFIFTNHHWKGHLVVDIQRETVRPFPLHTFVCFSWRLYRICAVFFFGSWWLSLFKIRKFILNGTYQQLIFRCFMFCLITTLKELLAIFRTFRGQTNWLIFLLIVIQFCFSYN